MSTPEDQRQSFTAYVAAELKRNTSDRQAYEAIELPEGVEERWHRELLGHWLDIITRAQKLIENHRWDSLYRE